MASMHDISTIASFTGAQKPPHLVTLTDNARDVRAVTVDGLLEPLSGHISAWCKGDGTATSFTIGKLPANCIVKNVVYAVSGTAGTAGTTLAIGISGTTGKYVSAATATLNTAGMKAPTTIPIHETTAQTVLATFSAAWDSGAKVCVIVHYVKVPAVPA